jgi:hypothetical protein
MAHRSQRRRNTVLGSICPICWGRHVWTNSHEIVTTAISGDQLALIAELSSLGVSWPAGYAPEDPDARAYGLLRMLDDAAAVGLDCSEVASEWVISRPIQAPETDATLYSRLPRSA